MPITKIEHKGKKIIFVDFSHTRRKQDMIDMIFEVTKIAQDDPDDHLLFLFDYTDAFVSSEFMEKAKEQRQEVLKTKTVKSAALGITGMKKIILKGYNTITGGKGVKPFENKEEALDYLAE